MVKTQHRSGKIYKLRLSMYELRLNTYKLRLSLYELRLSSKFLPQQNFIRNGILNNTHSAAHTNHPIFCTCSITRRKLPPQMRWMSASL